MVIATQSMIWGDAVVEFKLGELPEGKQVLITEPHVGSGMGEEYGRRLSYT
jgi:hypothetical protein